MTRQLTLLFALLLYFGISAQPTIYGSGGYSQVSGSSLNALKDGYRFGLGWEHPATDTANYWGVEVQYHSYFPGHRHWQDSVGSNGYDLYIQQFQLVQVLGTVGRNIVLNERITLQPKLGLGFGMNRFKYEIKSGVYTTERGDLRSASIGFDASLRASLRLSHGVSAAFVVSYVSNFMRGIFLTAWQPSVMITWQVSAPHE